MGRRHANGEWKTPLIIYAQFQNVSGNDIGPFKDMSRQIVAWPDELRAGNLIYPSPPEPFAPDFVTRTVVSPQHSQNKYSMIAVTKRRAYFGRKRALKYNSSAKPSSGDIQGSKMGWTQFISGYGIWIVATFIALESVGLPLPAEAALMATALFAAKAQGINIHSLITAGIGAAIIGEVTGFWIGQKFGYELLVKYGHRFGVTEERIRIGQWLFVRYGAAFVFVARFLPFLRNIAAALAGTNCMPKSSFYLASASAAASWVLGYGLAAYFLGEAFMNSASPVTISVGIAASIIILIGVPAAFARCEKSLLTKTAALHPGR